MNVAMNSHPGNLECCCRKLAPNWLLQTQLNPRVVQQQLLQKYRVLLVLDKEAAATNSTRNGDLNELQHKGAGRYNRSPCSTVHTSTTKPRLNTGRSSVAGPAEPARSSTRSYPRTNSQASNNNAFAIALHTLLTTQCGHACVTTHHVQAGVAVQGVRCYVC